MHRSSKVVNVVVAGLGGQGVITAADIVAEAAFRAGYDVKKSELHGMSQRGGSVTSDVRFGAQVHSPMVPRGEADFLVVLAPDQIEANRYHLRKGGALITPDWIDEGLLANRRSLNVAEIGALSAYVDITESDWMEAIGANLPESLREANVQAFRIGRAAAKSREARQPGGAG
jgi:indolepyruvate ferredoxin oxidoreductase beta subunit